MLVMPHAPEMIRVEVFVLTLGRGFASVAVAVTMVGE
jgi:hypothetical protein